MQRSESSGSRAGKTVQPTGSLTDRDLSWLRAPVLDALQELLDAYRYAADLGVSRWEFAVTLGTLRRLGLNRNDVRWLVRSGVASYGVETTLSQERVRQFRHDGPLDFSRSLCFVLTDDGLAAALSRQWDSANEPASVAGHPRQAGRSRRAPSRSRRTTQRVIEPAEQDIVVPHWDRDRKELRVGDVLVKRFKAMAPNQEIVLAAFEEEHWPRRIDDPLPPHPEIDPKRRLHDTVNSLNRSQKKRLIGFLGDGTGQGIRWEFVQSIDEATKR